MKEYILVTWYGDRTVQYFFIPIESLGKEATELLTKADDSFISAPNTRREMDNEQKEFVTKHFMGKNPIFKKYKIPGRLRGEYFEDKRILHSVTVGLKE